jgi:hypothetical protein
VYSGGGIGTDPAFSVCTGYRYRHKKKTDLLKARAPLLAEGVGLLGIVPPEEAAGVLDDLFFVLLFGGWNGKGKGGKEGKGPSVSQSLMSPPSPPQTPTTHFHPAAAGRQACMQSYPPANYSLLIHFSPSLHELTD